MKRLEVGDIVQIAGWESLGPFEYVGTYGDRSVVNYRQSVNKLRYLFGPSAGQFLSVRDTVPLRIKEPQND